MPNCAREFRNGMHCSQWIGNEGRTAPRPYSSTFSSFSSTGKSCIYCQKKLEKGLIFILAEVIAIRISVLNSKIVAKINVVIK